MIDFEQLIHNLSTQEYHIIDNFLELTYCESLRSIAQDMEAQGLFRNAKIGLHLGARKNNTIRTDKILWVNEKDEHLAVQVFLKTIQQVMQIINQSFFLSLYEFETHFAIYQPGTFYKKHVDQFAKQKTRKISCVYYLNKDWQTQFGGELTIYNKESKLIQKIMPQENRFICFNSELPHEVCLTHQARYSITGWLKTRSSPLGDIISPKGEEPSLIIDFSCSMD